MLFPIVGDDLASTYRAKGDTASEAFADAEGHLNAEEIEEALHDSQRALELFRKSGTKDGVADALRVVVKAMCGREKSLEAVDLAKEELANFRKASDKAGEAKMLLSIADAQVANGGNKDAALASATEAKALFGSQGNKKMEVAALLVMATATLKKDGDKENRAQQAIGFATKAKELCEEPSSSGFPFGEAQALHVMACAHALAGATESCLGCADEALDVSLSAQNSRMAAFEWLCLSSWNLEAGNKTQALWDAEDAMEVFQKVKSPKEKDALSAMCAAYFKAGKLNRARRVAMEALARYEEAGNREAEAAALDALVQVYTQMGDDKRAMNAAEKALAIVQDLGDKTLEAKRLTTLAGMHFAMGNLEQALQMGEDALILLKECGDPADKVVAMDTVASTHLAKQDDQAALEVATDMEKHFSDAGDTKGEAAALLVACAIQFQQEQYDQAAVAATRAQSIFNEEGDTASEGLAMRWLAEVQTMKKEHKTAIRTAERGRTLFRELGDEQGEAAMLYQCAQNCVLMAAAEGAKGNTSRASKDALEKAAKCAKITIKVARESRDQELLLACALCAQAQVHLSNNKPDEALEMTDEAAVLFRENGDFALEAQALLLCADALRGLKMYRESTEAANEALSLFKQFENEKGEEMAQSILTWLEEAQRPSLEEQQRMAFMQQQQWMAQQQAMGGGMPMNLIPIQQQGYQPDMGGGGDGRSLARADGPRGPSLDMSAGLEEGMVRAKVLEIAVRITGAEEGEIEADTPLMEAGLTSNSAILLRDELSQELPGLNLPVTLVFDYPSISSMAELIVETSASKALK